jgi:hypothetical protein
VIFTIGSQESYDRALHEATNLGRQLFKLGQTADYPGGYAFRTVSDAERRIAEAYPGRGFAVYELDGDWDEDTCPAANGWWRHLTHNRPILGRHFSGGG